MANWKEVMDFMKVNKRRPSKYAPEERNTWNWLRHNQKLYSRGMLKEERIEPFKRLLALMEENKYVNQYV